MAKKIKTTFRHQVEQKLITTFDLNSVQADSKKLKRSLRKASKILSKALKPAKTEKPADVTVTSS